MMRVFDALQCNSLHSNLQWHLTDSLFVAAAVNPTHTVIVQVYVRLRTFGCPQFGVNQTSVGLDSNLKVFGSILVSDLEMCIL